jgi:ATP-dependent RNA helicase DDX46/PRP5
LQVRLAINEIKRILIEASTAALEAEARNPGGQGSGRYNVL